MDDTFISRPETLPVEPADANDERRAYVERLVAARCPELTGDEIDGASANWRLNDIDTMSITASAAPVIVVPAELAERIQAALRLIVERIDRLEGWVRVEGAA